MRSRARSTRSKAYRRRQQRRQRRRRFLLPLLFVCLASLIYLAVDGGLRDRLIPSELQAFAERNPEASSYVNNYPWKRLIPYTINLRGEVTAGEIPLFIQWDERWGYKTYGSGLMGLTGCGPTCLSMVVSGKTGRTDANPLEIARWAENNGYYVWGAGTAWSLMTDGAVHYGLSVEEGEVSGDYIQSHLSPSTPIICSVGPGDFTLEGHFIVLTGIDENGNILLHDPNSPQRSREAWSLDRLLNQISGLWWYP